MLLKSWINFILRILRDLHMILPLTFKQPGAQGWGIT